jgi:hypothetical protein
MILGGDSGIIGDLESVYKDFADIGLGGATKSLNNALSSDSSFKSVSSGCISLEGTVLNWDSIDPGSIEFISENAKVDVILK